MKAVVKTGGKQYVVAKGDTVRVEKLEGDVGAAVSLSEVLLVSKDDGSTLVGAPLVANCHVTATIAGQEKAKKIIVFKIKRRKGYRRKQGHRQQYTELRIGDIVVQ